MKRLFFFVATLIASSAFALDINDHSRTSGDVTAVAGAAAIAGASVNSRISNDVRANAAAFQAQGQQQDQRQSVNLAPSTGGNTLSVNLPQELPNKTITNRVETNDYKVATVPNVFSGNVYPTAPCMGSSAVGGSGVGFGFSIGSSWKDDECGIRETARSFNGMGMKEDALKVLCTSVYAAAAPSCAPKGEVK